jgi:TRAP-type C4-dicarboxylate transport system permease small subunit
VRALERLCRWLAVLGGIAILAAVGVTVVSVTGRYLLGRPIVGDTELVAMLTAMAVSLFLPYCQLRRGNVSVDVFTQRARPAIRETLDALGCLLLALAFAVLAWRVAVGGTDMWRYNDQSTMLALPTWWAFAVMAPAFALTALAGLVTAGRAYRARRAEAG